MDMSAYHSDPAVGSTGLRALLVSPAHYQALGYSEQTPAQRFGTLVHTLTLEPHTVPDRYVAAPNVDRRTRDGKAEWAAFQEAAGAREIVDAETLSSATACATAIAAHRVGRLIRAASRIEEPIFWEDAVTGIRCKARPDAIAEYGVTMAIDVKTTRDASPRGFQRAIATYGYHVQAAHYLEACAAAGIEARGFLFACVESAPPHHVAAYLLDAEPVEEGRALRTRALDVYASCVASGEWPSYGGGKIMSIGLPRWAYTETER